MPLPLEDRGRPSLGGDERNRVIGQVQVGYQLTDWSRATARTGTDWYRDDRIKVSAANTPAG